MFFRASTSCLNAEERRGVPLRLELGARDLDKGGSGEFSDLPCRDSFVGSSFSQ